MPAPISVIILTFNEERNLEAAIESVKDWSSEVFVVDSFSTDRTVDIALSYAAHGVRVVQHAFEDYAAQWNWALAHLPVTQPWTFKLDADERATPAFRAEVEQRLAAAGSADTAFVVHWKLIFMGRWLKWGGLFPNGNTRIWRTGLARFERRSVNEHLVVAGGIGHIRNPIEHHDYKDLGSWLDRHNRYSSLEAAALIRGNLTGELTPRLWGRPDERRVWLRRLYYRIPGRAFWYFLYRYLLRLGLLDGWTGFRFALLHAVYLYWIDLKIREYRLTGKLPEVIWPSRGQAHPAVADSELQQAVSEWRVERGEWRPERAALHSPRSTLCPDADRTADITR